MIAVVHYDKLLFTAPAIDEKVLTTFAEYGEAIPTDIPTLGSQLRVLPIVKEQAIETVYHCGSDELITRIEHEKVVQTPALKLKPVDEVKTAKLADLAHYRWLMETGGIEFNGTKIKTDEPSQAKVQGALTHLTRNPDETIKWKGENGWVSLNKTAIGAIADLVAAHVQKCYALEQSLAMQLGALSTSDALYQFDIQHAWAQAWTS